MKKETKKTEWKECKKCNGVGLDPNDLDKFCSPCGGYGGWWVEVAVEAE